MRSLLIGGVVFLLGVVGSVAVSHAQIMCDYLPPQNQLQALSLSGDYRYFDDRYLDDRGNTSIGHVALQGFTWVEGPEWSYSLNGSVRLEFSREIALSATLSSEGSLRRYLNGDFFIFGGVDTLGVPFQQGLTINLLGGAGLGHFRNVTPMAKAVQVSQALQSAKVIDQPLSNEVLKAIADAIARQPELGFVGVLEEIEKQLGKPLGVAGVVAIQEIVRSGESRFCGWDASLAGGYTVISPAGQTNALVRAAANFATALDAQSQILAQARWYAPFPLTGESWLTISASFHRLLAPAANLSIAYTYSWVRQGGQENQAHGLDATVRFPVLPVLSVWVKGQASLATGFEEPEMGISVGFEYNLM
jgi:hypothetical protein